MFYYQYFVNANVTTLNMKCWMLIIARDYKYGVSMMRASLQYCWCHYRLELGWKGETGNAAGRLYVWLLSRVNVWLSILVIHASNCHKYMPREYIADCSSSRWQRERKMRRETKETNGGGRWWPSIIAAEYIWNHFPWRRKNYYRVSAVLRMVCSCLSLMCLVCLKCQFIHHSRSRQTETLMSRHQRSVYILENWKDQQ